MLGSWTEAEFGKEGKSLHRDWIYLHIAGRRETKGERGWCKAAITVRSVWLFPLVEHSRRGVGSGFLSPKPACFPGGSGSYAADLLRLEQGFGHGRATGCAGAVFPPPPQSCDSSLSKGFGAEDRVPAFYPYPCTGDGSVAESLRGRENTKCLPGRCCRLWHC